MNGLIQADFPGKKWLRHKSELKQIPQIFLEFSQRALDSEFVSTSSSPPYPNIDNP